MKDHINADQAQMYATLLNTRIQDVVVNTVGPSASRKMILKEGLHFTRAVKLRRANRQIRAGLTVA